MPAKMLSDEQAALLLAIGSWPVADALLEPASGCSRLRTSCMGGTHRAGGWFQCESKAVTLKPTLGADVVASVTVPYSLIAAFSATIPSPLRAELAAARAEVQAVTLEWVGKHFPKHAGEWPAHVERSWAAKDRLAAALAAVLAPVDTPVQLDLFAGAVS